jgi:hypothetical protein
MKRNVWGYLFAGVSALAGIVYLINERNQQAAQSVTNNFAPLSTPATTTPISPAVAQPSNIFAPYNTPETTPATSTDEPTPASTTNADGTSQQSPSIVPFPVYLV